MPCNQRHCKENSLKRGGQMANPLLQHYIKLTEFLGQALGDRIMKDGSSAPTVSTLRRLSSTPLAASKNIVITVQA